MPIDDYLKQAERDAKEAAKRASDSAQAYVGAVKNAPASDNAIYKIIANMEPKEEIARTKKLERSAAIMGIGEIAKSIGDGISIMGGVTPAVRGSVTSLDSTLDQVSKSRASVADKYNDMYKQAMTESLRREAALAKQQEAELKTLEKAMNDDSQSASKAADNYLKLRQKEVDNTAAAEAAARKAEQQRVTQAQKDAKEAQEGFYVFDKDNKKVKLDDADQTLYYRVALEYGLDGDFKQAKSQFQQDKEYKAMIQSSYSLAERDKAAISKTNSFITNSEPFTINNR